MNSILKIFCLIFLLVFPLSVFAQDNLCDPIGAVEASADALDFYVVGASVNARKPERSTVFIEDKKTGAQAIYRTGEIFRGLTIQEVLNDRVLLKKPDGSLMIVRIANTLRKSVKHFENYIVRVAMSPVDPDLSVLHVEDKQTGQRSSYKVGERFKGLLIVAVFEDIVALQKDDGSVESVKVSEKKHKADRDLDSLLIGVVLNHSYPGLSVVRMKDPVTGVEGKYKVGDRYAKTIVESITNYEVVFKTKDGSLWRVKLTDKHYNSQQRYELNNNEVALFPFEKDGFKGLMDGVGNVLIEAKYDDIICNNGQRILRIKKDGKWGFLDHDGSVITRPEFDEIGRFRMALAPIRIDDKWGFVHESGEVVTRPQFDEVGTFTSGNLAPVKRDGKWGFVNANGVIVLEPQFTERLIFSSGLARFKRDGKFGFIDGEGKVIIEALYEVLPKRFASGRARVKRDGKWGFINRNGEEFIEAKYDELSHLFFAGHVGFRQGGKWGFIDLQGNITVPALYEKVHYFVEGTAAVKKDGKWGFIYKDGKTAVKFHLDDFYLYSNGGWAPVKKDGKWGYVDHFGHTVVEPQYEAVFTYGDNRAAVKQDGKWGFIDGFGNMVIKPQYDRKVRFKSGLATVTKDGKTFLIDKNGTIINAHQ